MVGTATAGEVSYFKTGESCTVEAVNNGFVVHTEDGQIICGDPQQLVAVVLKAVTNHELFSKSQAEQENSNDSLELDDDPETESV